MSIQSDMGHLDRWGYSLGMYATTPSAHLPGPWPESPEHQPVANVPPWDQRAPGRRKDADAHLLRLPIPGQTAGPTRRAAPEKARATCSMTSECSRKCHMKLIRSHRAAPSASGATSSGSGADGVAVI